MELKKTIKRILKSKGISQKELAAGIGKSGTAVSQILNGEYHGTADTMEKIANYIQVPLPIISFMSLSEEDISPEKKAAFRLLKPTIDNLINEIIDFEIKPVTPRVQNKTN